MSDAVCGPSNPLQQFRKQTQLDRTLQQDRLSSRNSPSQGFRSIDAQPAQLDPEFEAFQAGLPPAELQHFQHSLLPHAFAAPPAGPSWATDFQRLQISPSPGPNGFQVAHSPEPGAVSAAGWAHDFRTHLATPSPRTQSVSPSPHAFQQRARFGLSGFQSQLAAPTQVDVVQAKGKAPVEYSFDDAAFEQAFDQAKQDLMHEVEPVQLAHGDSIIETTEREDTGFADALAKVDGAAREFSLQEERLRDQEAQEQAQQREDDDAMAATAHELLEKVAHNQSDKFKNSQFLGLMRKLRDREVKVEGDKMVETVSPPSHKHTVIAPTDSAYHSGHASPVPTASPLQHEQYASTEFDHWESPYW